MLSLVLNKILNSIFLRNVAILVLILTPIFLQEISRGNGNVKTLGSEFYGKALFLLLCIYHNRILYLKYLLQKKYVSYAILLLLAILLFQAMVIIWEKYWLKIAFPSHSPGMWVSIFLLNIAYVGLGFGLFYSFTHYREKHDALNIKYLARDLELKQLKEQLSPHFLFNALNNIYSYSIENHHRSSELILKLSELMRQILQNSSKDMVPVKEELSFIQHYIDFEKERLGKRCNIIFIKNIQADNINVPPFMFFTFLENAFKHGTNRIEQAEIEINLFTDAGKVYFSIQNPIINKGIQQSTGLGIANAKRRLELLYTDKHTFIITNTNTNFKVEVMLYL